MLRRRGLLKMLAGVQSRLLEIHKEVAYLVPNCVFPQSGPGLLIPARSGELLARRYLSYISFSIPR